MARARLTEAERELRRKARNRRAASDAAYRHYDPLTEGYGSVEDWIAAAEAIASGRGDFRAREAAAPNAATRQPVTADMQTLAMRTMPATLDGLKQAFRTAIIAAHPDHGGSNAAARAVLDAFARLKAAYPVARR